MTTTPPTTPTAADKPAKKHPDGADGRVPALIRPQSWLKWIAAVLVVLLIAEVAARIVEQTDPAVVSWYDAAAQQRVPMMDDREADVAFVGTSMAWQAFVPSTFTAADPANRSAFNAGLAGAVPVVMEPWILNEVDPRVSPDLVVWGLSSFDFAPNYGDAQKESYESAPETRTGALAATDRFGRSFSALIRMRTLMRRPSKLYGNEATETKDDIAEAARITGADGERLEFEVDKSDLRGRIVTARLKDFAPDQEDANSVVDVANSLTERGVDLVLVDMPVPTIFIDRHPNEAADYDRTGETIELLGRELSVDTMSFVGFFPDENFVDFTHLDEASTHQFTEWFADGLQALESGPEGCRDHEIVGAPKPVRLCRNR